MTAEIIYGCFKPRLIHPNRTPAADLAYALGKAHARMIADFYTGHANEQDMQASVDRVFCKRGAADPCEGTSKPVDSE